MPIRFRCPACNQLMGIARRKAGTVVRCPSCSRRVRVPRPPEDRAPDPPPAADHPVFERQDFEKIFQPWPAVGGPPADAPAPPPAASGDSHGKKEPAPSDAPQPANPEDPTEAEISVDVEPAAPSGGIWLTPTRVAILSVAVLGALALAFAAGVLTGLFLRRGLGDDEAGRPRPALCTLRAASGTGRGGGPSPAPRSVRACS